MAQAALLVPRLLPLTSLLRADMTGAVEIRGGAVAGAAADHALLHNVLGALLDALRDAFLEVRRKDDRRVWVELLALDDVSVVVAKLVSRLCFFRAVVPLADDNI